MVLYSIWLIFYLISYTTTYDKEILLYISRLLFSITIPASYSFLLFFQFKDHTNSDKKYKKDVMIFFIFFCIIAFSMSTDYVIADMLYNEDTGIYYEEY